MNLPFIKARCRNYEVVSRPGERLRPAGGGGSLRGAAELIEAAALAYARAKSAAILYSTGVELRDPETVEALVNLALLTGQIGKEGAGIFALTEHNNSQGVCDVGMLPDRLPGYRAVGDPEARAPRWKGLESQASP